jgi:MYXO-CTERM domain-containing protein
MKVRGVFLTLAACIFLTAPSRADVVQPPPDDCPPGTRGVTSHAGPTCVPDGSGTGGGANTGGSGGAVTGATGGQGPTAGTGGTSVSADRDLSQDSGCGCRLRGSPEQGWLGALLAVGWLGARRRNAGTRAAAAQIRRAYHHVGKMSRQRAAEREIGISAQTGAK